MNNYTQDYIIIALAIFVMLIGAFNIDSLMVMQ